MSSGRFIVRRAAGDVTAELAGSAPANPFATPQYFLAREQLQEEAWVFGIGDENGRLIAGCGGFVRKGRISRTLEIPSLDAFDPRSDFWPGLLSFCQLHGIINLDLGTYASPAGTLIPDIGATCIGRSRCEYVLDLSVEPASTLASNHKRNVGKARKAGVRMRRRTDLIAQRTHEALMDLSMQRRRTRGEHGLPARPSAVESTMLECGAGELFQAVRDEIVLSSVLVLRSAEGGYYQSAGTSPDGMAIGASHFLINAISEQLRSENVRVFNLGGADDESSLARFKAGFGATRVELSAAMCLVGPAWRRAAMKVIEGVRTTRRVARNLFSRRVSRLYLYATTPRIDDHLLSRPGLEFKALSEDDLHALTGDAEFKSRQLDRLRRSGASFAFAVYADGELAHVSWLFSSAAIAASRPVVLQVREDEVEISGCETLEKFRGRGIYGFAIANLLAIAQARGVRRVYMKTSPGNVASQAGIKKAGLSRVGTIWMASVPMTGRPIVVRL